MPFGYADLDDLFSGGFRPKQSGFGFGQNIPQLGGGNFSQNMIPQGGVSPALQAGAAAAGIVNPALGIGLTLGANLLQSLFPGQSARTRKQGLQQLNSQYGKPAFDIRQQIGLSRRAAAPALRAFDESAARRFGLNSGRFYGEALGNRFEQDDMAIADAFQREALARQQRDLKIAMYKAEYGS